MNNILIPNWPAPKQIKAFSTTRLNGVSQFPYDSFNLGDDIGDTKNNVMQNRALLKNILELPAEPHWLKQVHGNKVVNLNSNDQQQPQQRIDNNSYTSANTPNTQISADKITLSGSHNSDKIVEGNLNKSNSIADGTYTSDKNQVCIIGTADCLPVLLCDKSGTEVAAVHAGWRGLSAGIIEAALAEFNHHGDDILAWLGPAIGPTVYEVGNDVCDIFMAIDATAQQAFQPYKPGKWLANMNLLARQRLEKCGVHGIYGGDYCTFSDPEKFFSFRRDKQTGRMATLIWIAD